MKAIISLLALAKVVTFTRAAVSQDIDSALSFGQDDRISPDNNHIPSWQLSGEGHHPQILSDRIILTPPAPGHARGALWTDHVNNDEGWHVDIVFRASGQDRGTGNFQIWYIKDGQSVAGSNSVYTVPHFQGLVLTVDQHGGKGGMLRGFLNDGNTNYKDHHMVDSLAFGSCDFNYRNLGKSSKITVEQNGSGLHVKIDDQSCFSSDKITLPTGYHFGLTAATSDNPDSFEVNSFIKRRTIISHPSSFSGGSEQHHLPNAPEQLADRDAESIKLQAEQFADIHNRVQSMSHQINDMFVEFEKIHQLLEKTQEKIIEKIPRSNEESLSALSRRLDNIERQLTTVQKDVAGRDYGKHLDDLHKAVEGVRGGLSDSLPDTLHKSKLITNNVRHSTY